nr:uncharacterized protein LOC119173696 [Rhipicephalus microplus]
MACSTSRASRSGTEEQYTKKEHILQELSDYVGSTNYVPRIAPRSSNSSGRKRSHAAASCLATPPEQVCAGEDQGHAAQLLLSMTTPRSPAAVELTGEPCNEEEEEQQHHQQQQQLQPQLPPAARQRVPVTASRGKS